MSSKKKKRNVRALKRKLWKVFSDYIKLRDHRICFTCGIETRGRNSQGGHFYPKRAGGIILYFHEDNVACQCAACNRNLQGNQYVFGKKLGEQKVNVIFGLVGSGDIKTFPFEDLIQHYSALVEARTI